LARRLKQRFPRLSICLLLDGLYAGGPTFQVCSDYDWKYLIVLREDDLPNLHRSFAVAMTQLPNQRKQVELCEVSTPQRTEQVKQAYRWVEDLLYIDSQDRSHRLGLIECQETRTDTLGQNQAIQPGATFPWIPATSRICPPVNSRYASILPEPFGVPAGPDRLAIVTAPVRQTSTQTGTLCLILLSLPIGSQPRRPYLLCHVC
jgi:hypothetical protein